VSKATNRQCAGTAVYSHKTGGFESRPEDSYGRCRSHKITVSMLDKDLV